MIRSARPPDVPALFTLIRALARYERLEHEVVGTEVDLREHLFGAHPRAEVALVEGGVNHAARPPEGRSEADGNGEIAAFALFFHNYSTFLCKPGLYLEDLFVLPEHRRRGYGSALLRHLAQVALARGCGRFEWSVLEWNEPALAFYRSLGAQTLDDWRILRVTGDALKKLAAP
jgi:GNAT superfamily N-acetyltransferase